MAGGVITTYLDVNIPHVQDGVTAVYSLWASMNCLCRKIGHHVIPITTLIGKVYKQESAITYESSRNHHIAW